MITFFLHRQEQGPNILLVQGSQWYIQPRTRSNGGNDEEENYWYTHVGTNSPVAAGQWKYQVGGPDKYSGISITCRK